MKKRNKFINFAIASALVIGAIALPFASEVTPTQTGTTTITMDSEISSKSVYSAWRIFDVKETVTTEGETSTSIFTYTINTKYREGVLDTIQKMDASVPEDYTDSQIITWISKLKGSDIRTFADNLYMRFIKNKDFDATSTEGQFKNVPQGYYLIVETQLGDDPEAYSLVMLDTAGQSELTVKTKEDVVGFEKKIKETNDSTGVVTNWQDAADYDIGDVIPFKLSGTMPKDLTDYETYKYVFHDTECEGLTFNPTSVKVYIDDTLIDASKYSVLTDTAGTHDGKKCTFEVVIEDVIVLGAKANSVVSVEYTSTLNENANIGSLGNDNKAYLEFSNNPYGNGTGKTKEDKVIAFTYKTKVNKVDGAGDPLKGAGFTLYKFDAKKNDYIAVGTEITGADITTFEFVGIDAGKYKLVETTVPAGYNKAADVEFEIAATYTTLSDDPKLLTLEVPNNTAFTAEMTEGSVYTGQIITSVENLTGNELPETGGVGTTIFYVVGATLLLGGSILLIAKKKTEKA